MRKQDIMPKINIHKKNIRKERDRKTLVGRRHRRKNMLLYKKPRKLASTKIPSVGHPLKLFQFHIPA